MLESVSVKEISSLFYCEHPISSIAVTTMLANTEVCDFIVILSVPEDLEVRYYNHFWLSMILEIENTVRLSFLTLLRRNLTKIW